MAIKLNTKIFNQINQFLNSGTMNKDEMTNINAVIFVLHSVKMFEASEWVQNNTILFRRGLLEGFEIDNSQDQALRDIHTRE